MKQLIAYDPVFTPGAANAGTLDFTQVPGFQPDLLYGVINVTRNQIIYAPGSTTYGGTFAGPILTLAFNTSSYATNDELNIYYETQPTGTSIIPWLNNQSVERGGMLESHNILLTQILAELKVHTFILSEGFRVSHQDIDFARNDAMNPVSEPPSGLN